MAHAPGQRDRVTEPYWHQLNADCKAARHVCQTEGGEAIPMPNVKQHIPRPQPRKEGDPVQDVVCRTACAQGAFFMLSFGGKAVLLEVLLQAQVLQRLLAQHQRWVALVDGLLTADALAVHGLGRYRGGERRLGYGTWGCVHVAWGARCLHSVRLPLLWSCWEGQWLLHVSTR